MATVHVVAFFAVKIPRKRKGFVNRSISSWVASKLFLLVRDSKSSFTHNKKTRMLKYRESRVNQCVCGWDGVGVGSGDAFVDVKKWHPPLHWVTTQPWTGSCSTFGPHQQGPKREPLESLPLNIIVDCNAQHSFLCVQAEEDHDHYTGLCSNHGNKQPQNFNKIT